MADALRISGPDNIIVPLSHDINKRDLNATHTETPQWMIGFFESDKYCNTETTHAQGALCQSSIKQFVTYNTTKTSTKKINLYDFTELLGWQQQSNQYTMGNISGNQLTSGAIQESDVVALLHLGEHGPCLEQRLYNGKHLHHVIILRLGIIEDEIVVLNAIEFQTVRIRRFQMNMAYIAVHLQISTRLNDIQEFDQAGVTKGHKVMFWNFRTASSNES